MNGQSPEERRAALVERIAEAAHAGWTINPGESPAVEWGRLSGINRRPRLRSAEAVLALLESGDAGVYLVGGSDIQEAVGRVLGQLREAREELRQEKLRHQFAEREASDLRAEVDRLRGQVDDLAAERDRAEALRDDLRAECDRIARRLRGDAS